MSKDNRVLLKLEIEPMTTREGEIVKDNQDNVSYKRHDGLALYQLLNALDAKAYGYDDYRIYLNVQDKIEDAWRKEKDEVSLLVEEASFLKDFLKNFKDKSDPRASLKPFLLRSLVGVVEQLDE